MVKIRKKDPKLSKMAKMTKMVNNCKNDQNGLKEQNCQK